MDNVTHGDRLDFRAVHALDRKGGGVLEGEGQLRELPQAVRPARRARVVAREEPAGEINETTRQNERGPLTRSDECRDPGSYQRSLHWHLRQWTGPDR